MSVGYVVYQHPRNHVRQAHHKQKADHWAHEDDQLQIFDHLIVVQTPYIIEKSGDLPVEDHHCQLDVREKCAGVRQHVDKQVVVHLLLQT